jgi:hypothetical protein
MFFLRRYSNLQLESIEMVRAVLVPFRHQWRYARHPRRVGRIVELLFEYLSDEVDLGPLQMFAMLQDQEGKRVEYIARWGSQVG